MVPPAAGSGAAGHDMAGAPSAGDGGSAAGSGGDGPTNPIPGDLTQCGDGRVTGQERCDISIAAGTPGACPIECPEREQCRPRALESEGGCQAACVYLQLLCKSGDDCCPGNCTQDNDSDCSANCGDGIVQTDSGETCEAESSRPCKTEDSQCDDGDACTGDKLIGSQSNCNAACTNTPITDPKDGDGCCPTGANANTDKDCQPSCGNAIREPGEECDSGLGCSAACKLTLTAPQLACLQKFSEDDCAKCSCMNCATTYMACRDGMDASANAQCNAVLSCARESNCYGTACYCGASAFCVPARGMCKTEVEIAAASTDAFVINARAADPNYPIGRAYAADVCRMQQCSDVCR